MIKDTVRRELASDLLQRSQRPIRQMALAAGFQSERRFVRAFKGCTWHEPGRVAGAGAEVCSWRSAGGPSQRRQPGRKRPVSAAMCAGPSPQQPPKAVTPCCCQPCARVTKSSGEMVSTKLQSGILK